MKSRQVLILLIVAVLVIAGSFWLAGRGTSHGTSASMDKPVLPDLKKALNDVTELRLAKADGTHATLRKQGTDWKVVERDFAADATRVRKFLLDLSTLKVDEEKTSNPARYPALNVEDVASADPGKPIPPAPPKENQYDFTSPVGATRVDVVTGARTWSLINGKSGGGKSGYVRVVGSKQSVLASPRLETDSEPQRWLDKTIVDIGQARIQSVAVQPAKGPTYAVTRDKRETEDFTVSNIPKGRKLSAASAGNALANGLESLSLDDLQTKSATPAAPAPGVTVENSKATYRTFDGVTVELTGRKESAPAIKKDDPKIEHFFITVSASSSDKATQAEADKLNARVAGKQFEISSYKYEGMFKPIDDLLEALPAKPEKTNKPVKAAKTPS